MSLAVISYLLWLLFMYDIGVFRDECFLVDKIDYIYFSNLSRKCLKHIVATSLLKLILLVLS